MRNLELYEYIKLHNIRTTKQLQNELKKSMATIRRRVIELENAGLIVVTRGGRFELVNAEDLSKSDELKQKNINVATKISAKQAAKLVCDNDIIFVDNGTTIREMLNWITARDVKIYTNGVNHNVDKYIDLNLIPGKLLVKEASLVGSSSITYLSMLPIDKSFVGINGFDEQWIYTPNREEMLLKQFALNHATDGYIVATENKRNVKSKYKVCAANCYKIITEKTI